MTATLETRPDSLGGRRNVPQTACRLRRFTTRPTSLGRSGRPGPDEQRQVDGDDRGPEPSTWALGSGYEPAVDMHDLSRQIEREYQTMLNAAADALPDDLPITKVLTRGPAGPAIVAEAKASD